MNDEFNHGFISPPIARRGFTSVEAVQFVRTEFPAVPHWTCWEAETLNYGNALRALVGKENPGSGKMGEWTWERVTSSYPAFCYWNGNLEAKEEPAGWVGFLRVRDSQGAEFLLFSYLSSKGLIGSRYLASTADVTLLERFLKNLQNHYAPQRPNTVTIQVQRGQNVVLSLDENGPVFLEEGLMHEIEEQVFSFFANKSLYEKLGLPYRRGFLLVGAPGTGKTLTVKHLIRKCYQKFQPYVAMLQISRKVNEQEVECFFETVQRQGPALVILEELDSLTKECELTRAGLLAQLDGVGTKDGFLILGTTNNPEDIDPALIHRPSRFDRVWRFELPDFGLRQRYLQWRFAHVDELTLSTLAEETDGWSFAYLNELRTTAALLSLNRKDEIIQRDDLKTAFMKLSAQFDSGRKSYCDLERNRALGFQAA